MHVVSARQLPRQAIEKGTAVSAASRTATMNSGLLRSRRHRMIAGVCGGLAEWLGWNPTLVRVLYVVGSLVSAAFPGLIVYLVLWLVMPSR